MGEGDDMYDMDEDDEEEENELTAEEWKGKGNDCYRNKQYKDAIDMYGMAILMDPTNPSFYLNRAAAYLMLLLYKECIEDCDKSIELDSNNAKGYFRKASALRGLGSISDAIKAYTAGLEVEPTNNAAKKDKDELVMAQGKFDELKDMLENESNPSRFRAGLPVVEFLSRKLGSNNRDVNLARAECLSGVGRTEEAYNLSNDMMRTASGDLELLVLRAKLLCTMGDIENAVKHLQSAMRSDPDNAKVKAFYKKTKCIDDNKKEGDTAYRGADYKGAIEKWTFCIDESKNYKTYLAKLYCNRAQANSKLKDNEKAVDDCTRSIGANSQFIKAYLRRAEFNYVLGGKERLTQCVQDYEKLGRLYESQGIADEDRINIKQKVKQAKVALKRVGKKDLYASLGISAGAGDEEIKKAYKKAALKFHPGKATLLDLPQSTFHF